MDNAQRVRERRRKLLRKEPTNYTLRARMGQYRRGGDSDKEQPSAKGYGQSQKESNMTKQRVIPKPMGKPPVPKNNPNLKKSNVRVSPDDVRSTKGTGTKGTQGGESQKTTKQKSKQTAEKMLIGVGTTAGVSKIIHDAQKLKPKRLMDKRKRLAITNRSNTINVDKKGNARVGNNPSNATKERAQQRTKRAQLRTQFMNRLKTMAQKGTKITRALIKSLGNRFGMAGAFITDSQIKMLNRMTGKGGGDSA
jgi:hypothetical protein